MELFYTFIVSYIIPRVFICSLIPSLRNNNVNSPENERRVQTVDCYCMEPNWAAGLCIVIHPQPFAQE